MSTTPPDDKPSGISLGQQSSITVGQGDVVGRDKITVNIESPTPLPPSHQVKLDRESLLKIQEELSGSVDYMRDRDYGSAFPLKAHDGLDNFLYHSKRPEFKFLDGDMELLRQRLIEKGLLFHDLIAKETFPMSGRDWNKLPDEHDTETAQMMWHRAQDNKEHFEQLQREYGVHLHKVKMALNNLADEICAIYDELVSLGRRKLGI